jgi:hypothetical protein
MAFVNAAPLARVLAAALPSCHNTRDTAAFTTMDSLYEMVSCSPHEIAHILIVCC